MSNYYGDLISDYDETHNKGFYGGLPVYIKVKSSPSDNVKLTHTYKLARSIEGTKEDGVKVLYNAHNGTHFKSKCHHNEISSDFKLGNNGLTYKVGYKPREWNDADKNIEVKHKSTFDTASTRVDSSEAAKFSAKIGPAHIWNTLDLAWNTKDKKMALGGSTNINFEDYHVGGSFGYDMDSHKMTGIKAIVLNKAKKGDYFFEYDVLEKCASVHALH